MQIISHLNRSIAKNTGLFNVILVSSRIWKQLCPFKFMTDISLSVCLMSFPHRLGIEEYLSFKFDRYPFDDQQIYTCNTLVRIFLYVFVDYFSCLIFAQRYHKAQYVRIRNQTLYIFTLHKVKRENSLRLY